MSSTVANLANVFHLQFFNSTSVGVSPRTSLKSIRGPASISARVNLKNVWRESVPDYMPWVLFLRHWEVHGLHANLPPPPDEEGCYLPRPPAGSYPQLLRVHVSQLSCCNTMCAAFSSSFTQYSLPALELSRLLRWVLHYLLYIWMAEASDGPKNCLQNNSKWGTRGCDWTVPWVQCYLIII